MAIVITTPELYVLIVLKNNGMSNILMTIVRVLVKGKYNLVYNYTIQIIKNIISCVSITKKHNYIFYILHVC